MPYLSSDLCQQIQSKGLSLNDQVNVAQTCTFNGPAVISMNSVFVQSTIDSYSLLRRQVKCINAQIGRYCKLGDNVTIGQIKIPTNVFSPSLAFHGNIFDFADIEPQASPNLFKQIPELRTHCIDQPFYRAIIGNDVYIGADTLVVNDVHIGHGAIIHPHARIYKDVPPYAIIQEDGVQVGSRFTDEEISDLLELQWWQYDVPQMLKAGLKVPLDKASELISFFKNTDVQHFILAPNHWYSFTIPDSPDLNVIENLELTELDGQPQLPGI